MPNTSETIERVAKLEVLMCQVMKTQAGAKEEREVINKKLDDLLALRNKGVGAFWLATSLAGVGAFSLIAQVLSWFGLKFSG